MDIISKLNQATHHIKLHKKITELIKDHEYPIDDIMQIDTKYGIKIVLHLKTSIQGQIYSIILPNRYANCIKETDIKEILKAKNLRLVYKGLMEKDIVELSFLHD